jgi:hypothetical protein
MVMAMRTMKTIDTTNARPAVASVYAYCSRCCA